MSARASLLFATSNTVPSGSRREATSNPGACHPPGTLANTAWPVRPVTRTTSPSVRPASPSPATASLSAGRPPRAYAAEYCSSAESTSSRSRSRSDASRRA